MEPFLLLRVYWRREEVEGGGEGAIKQILSGAKKASKLVNISDKYVSVMK